MERQPSPAPARDTQCTSVWGRGCPAPEPRAPQSPTIAESVAMTSPEHQPRPAVPFSFELYPPRTAETGAALETTIRLLADAGPRFISVTYGAGGTSKRSSIDVLRFIRDHTDVDPLAHLTCIGSTAADANRVIREFLDEGITNFLALRGDAPQGTSDENASLGDLRSAAELVQLIHRVQVEREPYSEFELPGLPSAKSVQERHRVRIGVAAFPNGHPNSRGTGQDIDTLLAKQAAGATFAITQLFFHADDYLTFVERAGRAGVRIPILPGIMPITGPARLRRVLELTGEEIPADLAVAIEIEPTEEGRRRVGIDHAVRLAAEVLDGGAPGLHLYAFNQHSTVLSVLADLGIPLTPSPSRKEFA